MRRRGKPWTEAVIPDDTYVRMYPEPTRCNYDGSCEPGQCGECEPEHRNNNQPNEFEDNE